MILMAAQERTSTEVGVGPLTDSCIAAKSRLSDQEGMRDAELKSLKHAGEKGRSAGMKS